MMSDEVAGWLEWAAGEDGLAWIQSMAAVVGVVAVLVISSRRRPAAPLVRIRDELAEVAAFALAGAVGLGIGLGLGTSALVGVGANLLMACWAYNRDVPRRRSGRDVPELHAREENSAEDDLSTVYVHLLDSIGEDTAQVQVVGRWGGREHLRVDLSQLRTLARAVGGWRGVVSRLRTLARDVGGWRGVVSRLRTVARDVGAGRWVAARVAGSEFHGGRAVTVEVRGLRTLRLRVVSGGRVSGWYRVRRAQLAAALLVVGQ